MSITTILIGLLIILTIYIFLSEFYLKRYLNIKYVRKGLFTKGRIKVFVTIESILLVLFIVSSFYTINNVPFSDLIRVTPMFLLFFFLNFFRGMEEWINRKSEKVYYHEWLGSLMFLVMFLFILVGELFS